MTRPTDWCDRFDARLRQLADDEDRATLAKLRRGLGKDPAVVLASVGWLFGGVPDSRRHLDAACLVASLFAAHPQPGGTGDLGEAFRRIRTDGDSTERRFAALLDSNPDELAARLRHAVSLLRAKEVAVDWSQLLKDVLAWDYRGRPVQRRWSRSFWQEPEPNVIADVPATTD
jgi:CRISPR type I-E-associated protein CasB/Cse2